MDHHKAHFYFPENGSSINIQEQFDATDWKKANSIELGNNGNLKVKVTGQHHNNLLYLAFRIDDQSLINDRDRLSICIAPQNISHPAPENVALRYDFTFDDAEGRLFFYQCNNEEYVWQNHFPVPAYIEYKLEKDELLDYWSAVIQIDFTELELSGINPKAFALYLKILDYTGAYDFTPHSWPATVDEDQDNPYYVPPLELWGIGCFINNSKLQTIQVTKLLQQAQVD